MQLCINIRFKFSEIGVGRWERARGYCVFFEFYGHYRLDCRPEPTVFSGACLWTAPNFEASVLEVGPRVNQRVQDGEAGFAHLCTAINVQRLSTSSRASDPHKGLSNECFEAGIDIVGEDETAIVPHRVTCKVECARP